MSREPIYAVFLYDQLLSGHSFERGSFVSASEAHTWARSRLPPKYSVRWMGSNKLLATWVSHTKYDVDGSTYISWRLL